jgi:hypothetical protein
MPEILPENNNNNNNKQFPLVIFCVVEMEHINNAENLSNDMLRNEDSENYNKHLLTNSHVVYALGFD